MTLRVVIFFFPINLQHQWLHMHIYFMFVKEAKNCVEVYGLSDQRKQVRSWSAEPGPRRSRESHTFTSLGQGVLSLWARGFNRSFLNHLVVRDMELSSLQFSLFCLQIQSMVHSKRKNIILWFIFTRNTFTCSLFTISKLSWPQHSGKLHTFTSEGQGFACGP